MSMLKNRNLAMSRFACALLALVGGAMATEAQAQLEPTTQLGSRIPVKPKEVDPVRAGFVKKGFAQCLYRRSEAKAAALLANSDPVAVDYPKLGISYDALGQHLGMDDCLGEQGNDTQLALGLRFSQAQLRAMLQEEAYLASYKEAPSLPSASIELIDRRYVATEETLLTAKSLGAFSDCLTFKNTVGVDAVLRTMPGSSDERAAVKQLVPTLGACLVQGHTLSLTPASVRVFAADGLWNRYVQGAMPRPGEVNEKP